MEKKRKFKPGLLIVECLNRAVQLKAFFKKASKQTY